MSSARRLAAIDVGSNTVHLLVADVIDGRLRDVLHEVTMPRVGQAVNATGRVGPAKITEVAADVRRLAALAREHSAETLLLGATEAVRRAADRDAVLRAASEAAGVPCQVIPAEVEARLSFRGATGAHPAGGPVLVADIGGGSTECVLGEGGRVSALASVPVGSGTATDRWMVSDPPGPAERTACATGVRSALVEAPDGVAETGIVTGGTATTLPWLLGREASGELDGGDVAMCRHRLARHPSPVIAARHRIDPVRARVLAGGVEIVAAVMERYAMTRLIVSRAGVRDGMILAYVEKGDAWVEG